MSGRWSNWRIVIPSAGRAGTLVNKTLRMLEDGNVDLERVTVYVPNEEVFADYSLVLIGKPVNLKIAPHDPSNRSLDSIGVEPITVGRARNFIIRDHEPGSRIVFVDDDVQSLVRSVDLKTLVPIEDINAFLDDAWRLADASAVTLWGVYPVKNPYFMKPRANLKLTYIPGALFGVEVTGEPHELVVLDDKEDFERPIRHYLRDGRVLRFEDVSFVTTGYAGAGGMQLSRTPERVTLSARWLASEFPDLCSLNLTKRSGWVEVRLRDRRK